MCSAPVCTQSVSAHYEAGEVGKATRARRETERAAGKEERQATKDAEGAASAASALLHFSPPPPLPSPPPRTSPSVLGALGLFCEAIGMRGL